MAYRSNLRRVRSQMGQAKDRALTTIGELVRSESQVRSPVKTGAYRDSHSYQVEEDSVIVGNSMDYALWLEIGSSKQRGQHVIENSVMQNRGRIKQIVNQQYERLT